MGIRKIGCSRCGFLHPFKEPAPIGKIAVCRKCSFRFEVILPIDCPPEVTHLSINLEPAGGHETYIVGTAYYLDNIKKLLTEIPHSPFDPPAMMFQPCRLVPETDNRHDENAVRIECGDYKLGYLSREHAKAHREWLQEQGRDLFRTVITGRIEIDWTRSNNVRAFGVALLLSWSDE